MLKAQLPFLGPATGGWAGSLRVSPNVPGFIEFWFVGFVVVRTSVLFLHNRGHPSPTLLGSRGEERVSALLYDWTVARGLHLDLPTWQLTCNLEQTYAK